LSSKKNLYIFLLKFLVVKNHSDEYLVEINDAEVDEMISRIAYVMNPYSIAEIFITLKVKDY